MLYLTSLLVFTYHYTCFFLYTITCKSVNYNGWTHTHFNFWNSFLMGIFEMSLLQLYFYIYSAWNEKQVIFKHGLIWPLLCSWAINICVLTYMAIPRVNCQGCKPGVRRPLYFVWHVIRSRGHFLAWVQTH